MDVNMCIIEGRLVKDPIYAKTSSGKSKLTFSLAVSTVKDSTDYFEFQAWDGKADSLQQYLTKGKSVVVYCQARYQKWQDKNSGETKSKINFTVSNVIYKGGSSSSSANPADEYVNTEYKKEQAKKQPLPTTHFDESVPFGKEPTPENFEDDIPF